MTQLCHYTDDEGAEKVIRSGRILASLQSNGDAVFGNGVYLTKLKPESSTRAQVAQNNWLSNSDNALKKTKNVFVLEIPDNEVENVSTKTRDIFMFGGRKDLRLVKYKWYLQDFDSGKIIASYRYHIKSTGPAAAISFALLTKKLKLMGDYVMTDETVNGRPVYKYRKPWYNRLPRTTFSFLFMTRFGNWVVGSNTDKDAACLKQKGKYSLGPSAKGAWDYGGYDADGKVCWKGDDGTLKAYPWYKNSQWQTVHHSDSRIDPGSASTASVTATTALTTATTGTASIGVKALVHTATAITTPAPATNDKTPSVLSKSRPTSSKMPDHDNDKGLQTPGTAPSGRVYGGPPGKTTGLRRRLALMIFLFVLIYMLLVFGTILPKNNHHLNEN